MKKNQNKDHFLTVPKKSSDNILSQNGDLKEMQYNINRECDTLPCRPSNIPFNTMDSKQFVHDHE